MFGHLPPILESIKVGRTIYTVHCWRRNDIIKIDVLLWIPTDRNSRFGQTVKTYIHKVSGNTGCRLKNTLRMGVGRDAWYESQGNLCCQYASMMMIMMTMMFHWIFTVFYEFIHSHGNQIWIWPSGHGLQNTPSPSL